MALKLFEDYCFRGPKGHTNFEKALLIPFFIHGRHFILISQTRMNSGFAVWVMGHQPLLNCAVSILRCFFSQFFFCIPIYFCFFLYSLYIFTLYLLLNIDLSLYHLILAVLLFNIFLFNFSCTGYSIPMRLSLWPG